MYNRCCDVGIQLPRTQFDSWLFYICSQVQLLYTVVPALGDPPRERTPAMHGHVINVPTHLNVKLPAIGGHLPNADADSHLLVVSTWYNGQCQQMPRFPWTLYAEIAGIANFRPCAQLFVVPSGDGNQLFTSRGTNHVIVSSERLHYVRYRDSVFSSARVLFTSQCHLVVHMSVICVP